ncbi:Com family DNA-binding transcriptional regulator [uncultured Gemmobacter sp.]
MAGAVSIKCPRCASCNHLRPESPHPQRPDRAGKDASCGSLSPRKT